MAAKNKSGRPRVHNADEIADALLDYIDKSDDPMIEEFCGAGFYGISKDTVYRLAHENERLSDAIKECHRKQEVRTVRLAEAGQMNPTFAIFKLKQKRFGWTDKQEIEQTTTTIDITSKMSEEELEREIAKLSKV